MIELIRVIKESEQLQQVPEKLTVFKQLQDENTQLRSLLSSCLPTITEVKTKVVEAETHRGESKEKKHRRNNTQISLDNLANKPTNSEESSKSDVLGDKMKELMETAKLEKEQKAKEVKLTDSMDAKKTLFYRTPPNKEKKRFIFNN